MMRLTINAGHQEMETSPYGFNKFRIKVAEYLDKDFGDAYRHYLTSGDTDEFFEKAAYCDKLTFELVDFFLAHENEGEIPSKVSEYLFAIINYICIDQKLFCTQRFSDLLEFSAIWKLPICWKSKKLKFY